MSFENLFMLEWRADPGQHPRHAVHALHRGRHPGNDGDDVRHLRRVRPLHRRRRQRRSRKSGGNTFSGSLRTTFTNDDWRTVSPFDEPKVNDTVCRPTSSRWAARSSGTSTWFFGAGRFFDQHAGERDRLHAHPLHLRRRREALRGQGHAGPRRRPQRARRLHRRSARRRRTTSGRARRKSWTSAACTRGSCRRICCRCTTPGALKAELLRRGRSTRRASSRSRTPAATTTDLIDGTVLRDATDRRLLVVAELLRRLRAGRARQREHPAQGQLLPVDRRAARTTWPSATTRSTTSARATTTSRAATIQVWTTDYASSRTTRSIPVIAGNGSTYIIW